MTGEIDTRAESPGSGAWVSSWKPSYAAGCKTLIIPRENLTGAEGISRLPEALKHGTPDPYLLTVAADHEPFDYTRHVLQVVAVDDIVQAADVAFIDQEEIESLDGLFTTHAQKAFVEGAGKEPPTLRELKILYLDNPEEANATLLHGDSCSEDCGCVILIGSDIREDILPRVETLGGKTTIRSFDPSTERLADVVKEIKEAYSKSSGPTAQDFTGRAFALPEKRRTSSPGLFARCGFSRSTAFRRLLHRGKCADTRLPDLRGKDIRTTSAVKRRTPARMPFPFQHGRHLHDHGFFYP